MERLAVNEHGIYAPQQRIWLHGSEDFVAEKKNKSRLAKTKKIPPVSLFNDIWKHFAYTDQNDLVMRLRLKS